jgi:tetratricopeptide (TPR) repeat protein
MSLRDQHGNAVSTTSAEAVELYDRALRQFNLYQVDPLATLDAALAADEGFVMAHALKAGLLATTSENGAEPGIAAALEAAGARASGALERERMHLAAARRWLERDFAGAMKLYGDIVAEHPRDLAALQIAHLGDFLLGQSSMLRDRPAQALPAWSEAEAGHGVVLGMHAFGLEESGNYAQAESEGRRAVDVQAGDAWAAHAVAHVLEMQGRTDEGVAWLESTGRGWSEGNFFAYHNWWHLALYQLERENTEAALALYDTRIRPAPSKVAMEMVDASALLWRLRLRGVDGGARWEELADSWQTFGESGYYAFNDVHALMAFLATGREAEVRRVRESLERAARGSGTNATMSRDVGLPMARALIAFEHGNYATTIDELQRIRGIAQRFGGSHAQRDLLSLTLVEAALRAGRSSLARALTAERLALKPRSPFNWRLSLRAS